MSETKSPINSPEKETKERRERFTTPSGIPLERLYTEESLGRWEPEEALGYPGELPYTRGIYPSMYRGRLWTMRQYAGFGSAAESNQRYRYLLSKGQSGLSVAFDLPTQIGMDSDHALALGEVGKVGVAIDSLEDMERLFDGIPVEKVSTSMTINATAAILLSLYVAVAKKQGANLAKLSGTVQNDILKEYIARGTYIYPVRPAMRIVTDIFAWCRDSLPKWNTISISGYHMREAGSTAVQEVAFTLANAIAYVQASVAAGLDVDDFAPQLSFFFNAHNDLVEEVAKFRAARRLWARIMRERFGARDPRSTIDALGGWVAAVGYMQGEIQDAAYRGQREVEEKAGVVVGVNEFVPDDPPPANLFQLDAGMAAALLERLARLRRTRDAGRAGRALDALEAGARGRANLMPLLIEAVGAAAPLGETCGRRRAV